MNKTALAQPGHATSFSPPAHGILQRKCACGTHTMGGGQCADCAKNKNGLQRKLAIGASNDPLEQEADQVADLVMASPAHTAVSGAPPRVQRFTGHSRGENGTAPASVDRILSSAGRPLDPALRQDMEQRFDHDFSRVRVHTGAAAEQSAKDVNAHAYTMGHNVVFGGSQDAPQTSRGRWLLAHELAHVVQQTAAKSPPSLLQRAPVDKKQKKEKKRRDVVVYGEGWKGASSLARVVSRAALRIEAMSVNDLKTELSKIDFPVGTVYFIAHSKSNGSLKFSDGEGYVEPANIASKLQDAIPVENTPEGVDFRGCSVGTTPAAMDQIRAAMGAKSVLAGTCFAVINVSKPIKINKKEITKSSDVTKTNLALFKELKRKTFAKFDPEEQKCILNKSDKGFFAADGRFVSLFYNKQFTGDFTPGESVCYTALSPEVVAPNNPLPAIEGCKLIKVEQKQEAQPQSRPYEGPTAVEPPQP
jgi:hypothetical protein